VFQIVPGGHTDSVTGTQCHWNVFRVCNTTRMETNSVSKVLLAYGKKWYFITTDYAFGHGLQAGFRGQPEGRPAAPSSAPIHAARHHRLLVLSDQGAIAKAPDALILLLAGDDMINCLKQAVQFGLDKKFHIAGAQQELEVNEGLPPDALFGDWVFEWYWKQPGVPHVENSSPTSVRSSSGKVPTARTWFGYRLGPGPASLPPTRPNRSMRIKMAKAMQGLVLPPEIALMPNNPFYRIGDNQLMPTLFVGHSQPAPAGGDPEDLFDVTQLVKGVDAALPSTRPAAR
jgi:branched-chain amino acid transport system substrate-binding protein